MYAKRKLNRYLHNKHGFKNNWLKRKNDQWSVLIFQKSQERRK